MTAQLAVSRRSFVVGAAAGGLSLGFHAPFAQAATAPGSPEVNAWVVVEPDETVVVRIGRVEMGQGTLTGLAQLVAEELEADWSKVTTEYPTPGQNVARNRVWGDFQTAGSRGVRGSQDYMRKGGAAARMMLVQAAANQWGVPAAECTVAKGVITHGPSKRTTTYGKVATAAAKIAPPDPATIVLKDPKTWTIAGKSVRRLDVEAKLAGKQVYSMDVKRPGMLLASIRMCPVFTGKLKSFDASKVASMPGVKKVVQVDDRSVAVIADTWWRAEKAAKALPIEWDLGPNAGLNSEQIAATLKAGLDAPEAFVGNKQGDAKSAIAGAAKTIEAVYAFPYQHHVTMEPMNATALWTPTKCEVWTSTQNAEAALATTATAAGLPVQQCEVYRHHLGGGFGRRSSRHDFVQQAVLIAKQMPGTPIKLIWSREEDMTHGSYHPTTQCKLTGGLDANGNLLGLHMRISGQSILADLNPQALQGGADAATFQGLNPGGEEGIFAYDVKNLLIDHAMRNPAVPVGFWRGVNNNQNAIYIECFIDEMAHATGQDPLEFRRKLMANRPKHLAVLNAVAEKAGWGKPAPAGRARGLSVHMGYGSYVSACAEVSVSNDGVVTVHKITAATDCGNVVNPSQVAHQIEGSFAYGLSALLHGEIVIKDGRCQQTNFHNYPVIRMAEMPEVDPIIMPSGGFWGGVGEPTIFACAPAVLNAIFAATGKRVRQIPLADVDLKKA
jgi:isoquinoline 1-oxidoreductase beta subunit